MSRETELLQEEIRELIENFQALNRTVITTADGMLVKQGQSVKKSTGLLDQFGQALTSGTKATEKDAEVKKKLTKEQEKHIEGSKNLRDEQEKATNYAARLAREQLSVARRSNTLSAKLENLGGESVAYQKTLIVATHTLQNLSGGFRGFIGSLAAGRSSFETIAPVIDGVGRAMAGIPFVGGILQAAAEGAKFLLGQLQQSTDTFQKLSETGALTTSGMSAVQQQFLQSGMSLDGFRRAVVSNSAALARFGGTVGRGAEDFSKIVGQILDSEVGDQLRRLGFTADTFGEVASGYIEQQTRLGGAQTRTNAQLARGAAAYAKELDVLAKLTGMQREEIQKQQQAALSESRFRAKVDEMSEQGRSAEAKALMDFQTMVSKASPEMAQGFRDLATGNATTEAAQQVLRMGGQSILQDIESGLVGPVDAFKQFQGSVRENLPMMRALAKAVGDETRAFTNYAQASDLANAKLIDGQVILSEQNQQMAKGNDKQTDSATSAQKAMEQMSRQLQDLSFTLLPKFSGVIEKTTTAMRDALQKLGVTLPTASNTTAPATGSNAAPATGGGVIGAIGRALGIGSGKAPGAGAPADAGTLGDIRQMIGRAESRGDYNIMVGGEKANLTEMTLDEIFDLQKQRIQQGKGSAAGKYQFIYGTLRQTANMLGMDPATTKFDQNTQDELANYLIMQRGYNKYASGAISKEKFLQNLSSIWAGLPMNASGKSYYQGYNGNKATMSWDEALSSFQTGGISAGPKSGYRALLHGTEAVVPLPDGKNIPVEMPNLDRNMQEQVNMLGAQLVALEELVRYMRDNNAISTKILQATNN